MQVIRRVLSNPLVLRSYFPPDLPVGSVFLPELVDIPVGMELCIWIVLPSLQVDLYLTGTVQFRRLKAQKAAAGKPSLAVGSGLVLRPGHVSELNFLQRLLTEGAGPIAMRRFVRTPILAPWETRVVLPELNMWSPATMTEISLGGARVVLDLAPVFQGTLVKMEIPWQSGAVHDLQLAWFQMSGGRVRAGLCRPSGRSLSDHYWEALVNRALEHFRSQVRKG